MGSLIGFATSTLGLALIGAGAAVLLLLLVFHEGERFGKADDAITTLEETEDGRKKREANDQKARSLDDDAALVCLRHPEGCKR